MDTARNDNYSQDELCRLISLTPYAKDELKNARIECSTDDKLESARKFLVQAMMAINGVFGKAGGGFSYSQSYSRNGRDARVNRWYNLPERLELVVERLRDVRIENRNAVDLVEMFSNRPATLIYLDPPYLGDRTRGYKNDAFDEAFHLELLKVVRKAKCMIFISGYDSKLYNSILTPKRGWSTRTIDTITKDNKGNGHARQEVIWTNLRFKKATETNQMPLRLTKKELAEGKLNPIRK